MAAKSQSMFATTLSASLSPRMGRGQRLSSARAYSVRNAVCSSGVRSLTSMALPPACLVLSVNRLVLRVLVSILAQADGKPEKLLDRDQL